MCRPCLSASTNHPAKSRQCAGLVCQPVPTTQLNLANVPVFSVSLSSVLVWDTSLSWWQTRQWLSWSIGGIIIITINIIIIILCYAIHHTETLLLRPLPLCLLACLFAPPPHFFLTPPPPTILKEKSYPSFLPDTPSPTPLPLPCLCTKKKTREKSVFHDGVHTPQWLFQWPSLLRYLSLALGLACLFAWWKKLWLSCCCSWCLLLYTVVDTLTHKPKKGRPSKNTTTSFCFVFLLVNDSREKSPCRDMTSCTGHDVASGDVSQSGLHPEAALVFQKNGLYAQRWRRPQPQYSPHPLRLLAMMTSVTASKTNWMLLVSVAHVWWQ